MPSLKLSHALMLLRVATALVFFLHAIARVWNDTIGIFGSFLNQKGLVIGTPLVWAITAFELIGGVLLAIGKFSKLVCFGFLIILLVGIVLIHFSNGWFVGEHGTGGMEYSFILIIALLTVMSAEEQKSRPGGDQFWAFKK